MSCKRKNVSFVREGNFPTALLVAELVPRTLDGKKWMYIPSTAADCCEDTAAVEAFDATFPPKEKTPPKTVKKKRKLLKSQYFSVEVC